MADLLLIEALTADAFAPFGEVIDLADTQGQSINYGNTEKWANLAALDSVSEGGQTAIHRYRSQPIELPFLVKVMERHPLGSQAFVPLHGRPFLVVVARAGSEPDNDQVRGFITNGRQGVNYTRGTWHHYQISLEQPGEYLVVDRTGPGVNLDEFRLAKPLTIASISQASSS